MQGHAAVWQLHAFDAFSRAVLGFWPEQAGQFPAVEEQQSALQPAPLVLTTAVPTGMFFGVQQPDLQQSPLAQVLFEQLLAQLHPAVEAAYWLQPAEQTPHFAQQLLHGVPWSLQAAQPAVDWLVWPKPLVCWPEQAGQFPAIDEQHVFVLPWQVQVAGLA